MRAQTAHWALLTEFVQAYRLETLNGVHTYATDPDICDSTGAYVMLHQGRVNLACLVELRLATFDFCFVRELPLQPWLTRLQDEFRPASTRTVVHVPQVMGSE